MICSCVSSCTQVEELKISSWTNIEYLYSFSRIKELFVCTWVKKIHQYMVLAFGFHIDIPPFPTEGFWGGGGGCGSGKV